MSEKLMSRKEWFEYLESLTPEERKALARRRIRVQQEQDELDKIFGGL